MDKTWVEHLIKSYSSDLLKYIAKHTRSKEDAEDILQDVFSSVYEHCSEFDPERCNEQAWLYIIAKRKLVSYYRAQKDNTSLDELEDYQIPGVDTMSKAVNLMGARQAVANALEKLDERSRDIIILRFFKDMTADEVAKKMGLSPVNVRVIQSRALDAMKKEIGHFDFSE